MLLERRLFTGISPVKKRHLFIGKVVHEGAAAGLHSSKDIKIAHLQSRANCDLFKGKL